MDFEPLNVLIVVNDDRFAQAVAEMLRGSGEIARVATAATLEAQKIDAELEKLGKPCASSKPSDSAGKDASGKGAGRAIRQNPAAEKK